MAKQRKKRHGQRSSRRILRRLTRGRTLLAIVSLGAVAVFVVLIAISVATSGGGKIERIQEISAEGRIRGSATAPVTIIEFADFQCPLCKRFAETTGSQIEEEYVASDLVRMEFRNMAFIGPESAWAAEAAQCANDQGMFWEYHDKLFENQEGENRGAFSIQRLKRFAGELELDQDAFDACLVSEQYLQLILDETDAAQDAGIQSTPSFLINGELVRGALPISEFRRIIERKLEEAETVP